MKNKKNINDYDMNKYIKDWCDKLTDKYKDLNDKYQFNKKFENVSNVIDKTIIDVSNKVDNKIYSFTNKAMERCNNQWSRTADKMLNELTTRISYCNCESDKELICDKIDVIMLMLEKAKKDLLNNK